MTDRQTVDALLDAYSARGKAIAEALRLANEVINAPIVDYAKQRPLQDFAREVRAVLQPTQEPTPR